MQPMKKMSPSTIVFFGLVLLTAALAAIATFMPQGLDEMMPEDSAPLWQFALIAAGSVLFLYGGLGYVGLRLTRKLGYPDLLDTRVTTRQRFVIPCIVGLWLGLIFIVADNIFSRFHQYGPLPHPPFPTSILASFSAGIGEEMVFRLFFIPFLVWLISRVVLKGAQEQLTFWNAAIFSAIFFAAGHIPSVMYLLDVTTLSAIPPAMMAEIFLLNGALSLVAAYFLRRSGYLAAATVHTSADIVWHVIWGLLR
jgi:membrane protease YdiL (CAAX protease family)